MADTKNPTIITEAKTLARAADLIAALPSAQRGNKNSLLNTMACAIQGDGRNWGALKNSASPVVDPRAQPPQASPAPSAQILPTKAGTLLKSGQTHPVPLSEGKTGHIPMATAALAGDGAIVITCPLWGGLLQPRADDPVTHLTLVLEPDEVSHVAAEWPSADSLLRDSAWVESIRQHGVDVSDKYGALVVLTAMGVCALPLDQIFALCKTAAGAPSPEPAGYRYDLTMTFVSDEFYGTHLSGFDDLEHIAYQVTDGGAVGGPIRLVATPLSRATRNALAQTFGSDADFFTADDDIVGYQVENADTGEHWGDRPSFEIIKDELAALEELRQAKASGSGTWRLLTLQEGDVENPTFV